MQDSPQELHSAFTFARTTTSGTLGVGISDRQNERTAAQDAGVTYALFGDAHLGRCDDDDRPARRSRNCFISIVKLAHGLTVKPSKLIESIR